MEAGIDVPLDDRSGEQGVAVDRRDLSMLPKAHLHLHFTGSMSHHTLLQVAEACGEPVDAVAGAPAFATDATTARGWARFQRRYDLARRVVRSEAAMRTIVRCAAADEAAEGSRRLEIQVDPTSYAPWVGGLQAALEIVLDEARAASRDTGVQIGVIVAASRMRHPLDARTLARLASRYAGQGPGEVVAFGLNADEHHGDTTRFEGAFRIADRAGLPSVPHGGELRGPEHIRTVLDYLHPTRLGHGVRAAEDPVLLDLLVERSVALEVCPVSNVQLGVYCTTGDVPLRTLVDAGAQVALGADDPLLFGARLVDQYRVARDVLGFTDAELAGLARASLRASTAPEADKQRWLAEVDDWLAAPASRELLAS